MRNLSKVRTEKGLFNRLDFIIALYCTLYTVAPILSNRILNLWGVKILVGSFTMPLVMGLLDVINNNCGKEKARQTVLTAFTVRLVVWLWIVFTLALPTFREASGYTPIIHQSIRLFIAAEITLVISQYFIDIPIFDLLRPFGPFWLRYNLSTMISNTIGATTFMLIAFIGTDKPIFALIWGTLVFKLIIITTLTPLFSGLVRWLRAGNFRET